MINVVSELPSIDDGLMDDGFSSQTFLDNYALLHDLDNYPAFKEFLDNIHNPNE